jgi:hypothetical protein
MLLPSFASANEKKQPTKQTNKKKRKKKRIKPGASEFPFKVDFALET